MNIEISAITCRSDTLCRCRTCKPPLDLIVTGAHVERNRAKRLPSNRVVVGSTGLALLLMLGMCMGAHY